MADLVAHLVDEVLPHVPHRQWVLTFPHPVRLRLAYDPALCAAVRRIFVRVVLGWLSRRAASEGLEGARSGAIVFAQRFGGALNLNLHLHALVIDGVFTCASPFARPVFHPAPPLEDRDVEELTGVLRRRIVHYLRQRGVLPREGAVPPAVDEATAVSPGAAHLQQPGDRRPDGRRRATAFSLRNAPGHVQDAYRASGRHRPSARRGARTRRRRCGNRGRPSHCP